jgi:hypothetical protein
MFASGHLETKDLPMRELNRLNNLRQNKNKTYDTRLKELERELGLEWRKSVFMEEYDKTEDAAELKAEPTANMIRLWGRRPDPADYRNLEEKYAKLSQDIDIPNSVVEGLVRELCVISLEQRKCLESGSVQHYEKLVKAFQSTLDFINQRPQSNKPVENTDPLGVLLRDIEKYAPAEYYKDKKIFADSDRISEYIKKVFLRPMRNLLLGTRDEDAEYSVGDDGFA